MVDQAKPCSIVYALHVHETFGPVLSAHVVEHTSTGSLSLRHQRLLPENASQFSHLMDEADTELTRLLHEITVQQLVKHFGGSASLQAFLKKFSAPPHKDLVTQYVQKHVLQGMPLLAGKSLFRMSKDGYPAWKQLRFATSKAGIGFQFARDNAGTRYAIEVELDGKPLHLHTKPGMILTEDPAWVVHDDLVFTFHEPVDGKKLRPFLTKPEIRIAPEFEKEYYEKFLVRLVEHHSVTMQGIDVTETQEDPTLRLVVTKEKDRYNFRLVVLYDGQEFQPDPTRYANVQFEQRKDGTVAFKKLRRDTQREAQAVEQLFRLQPVASLVGFTLPEPEAIGWLVNNYAALQQVGIQVHQAFTGPQLAMHAPELKFEVKTDDDGFIVKPIIYVGTKTYHFPVLRQAIISGADYAKLPDDKIIHVPIAWKEELRHFAEVAEPLKEGEYRLPKYLAALIPGILGQGKNPVHPGMQSLLDSFDSIQRQPLPQGLNATLRDYQQAGYDWLCFLSDFGFGGILADDMGLGKTLQTLTFLLREKENALAAGRPNPRALIVVPNSLVFNWLYEAEKFAPALQFMVYAGSKRNRSEISLFPYDALITTYGMIRQDVETFASIPYHTIILDESQYIKNRDAKTTKAVMSLTGKHRLSLTGTPIENSTMDLWTQMHFLNRGLLGSEAFFERQYAMPIEREQSEVRATQLRRLIKPFILRRTKEQVASELPPMVEQVLACEMLPEQATLYEQNRQHYRNTFLAQSQTPELFEQNKIQILSSLQRLRQIAIHPAMIDARVTESGKYEMLKNMLNEILAEGRKVIVFSQFVKLLQIIKFDLMKAGVDFAYLDGSTKDRQKQVQKFQEDPNAPVFLMSIKAGGVGLNLTAAQYVLLMDPWWNPAVERQAVARAHRIGQNATVFCYKYITEGTIEEKILRLQERKAKIAGEIIRTDDQFFKSLTKEDLLSLFE